MSTENTKSVIVVGGGLVGSLCAIFMAQRAYHVTLFEYREDIRSAKVFQGRSINMALSNRGRRALEAVGLENIILKNAIPMKGRLIHDLNGNTKSVPYDAKTGQCIYSMGRNFLNKTLLNGKFKYLFIERYNNFFPELEKHKNVKIYFNHKLVSVNFEDETITVLNVKTQEIEVHSADLIIGADGAHSTLRRFMQQTSLFDYSQTYIKHGYLELQVPSRNGHKMIPNHLHIWPRGEFMMIALPNQDNSWTVTLFMPFSKFQSLKNDDYLRIFFKTTFPDSLSIIGEDLLVSDFFATKPSSLISVKCNPYHVGTKFLIIGDAAHAMVPFYGQGMNAGFEDCLILDKLLSKNRNNIGLSIDEFSRKRRDDAYAICELALYNYVEMRDLVTRKSFYLRKFFDDAMFKLFPEYWIPLYNSVTFSTMRYSKCIEHREWQNMIIYKIFWISFVIFILMIAFMLRIL